MIKGIQTSATAMRQGILRQEITAANLANANTTGFKRDRLFVREMIEAQAADSNPLQTNPARFTEFRSGAFEPTGNSLDFALQSGGFFVLTDGDTEVFTRNGHFLRDAEGQMIDVQGRIVQGEGGPITLPPGLVTVSPNGEISVDGAVIDRFRVVSVEDPQVLRKVAGAAFTADGVAAVPVEVPAVRQGFLETSNVDTVREMVEMISTARHYEINAKLVTAQDESLRHAVNDLGRV